MPELLPEEDLLSIREKCESDCDAIGLDYHEHPVWRLCAVHEFVRASKHEPQQQQFL